MIDGSIATPHWEACETCKNNDKHYGCVIKEDIPLSLYLGDWIICEDYEKENGVTK